MDTQDVAELVQQAMIMAMMICAPVVIVGMLVGLVMGLLQALTQIQEQSVTFVPKLAVMTLVLCLALPWMLGELVQYTHDLFTAIPSLITSIPGKL